MIEKSVEERVGVKGEHAATRTGGVEDRRRGIYVHVPFCVKKCYYCDFNSYRLDRPAVHSFLQALDLEMTSYAREIPASVVFDTLFIGGGTPTSLSGEDLMWIVRRVHDLFHLRPGAEVTCEANPGSSNEEKFACMREAGVNRLSMGVQSLDDSLLKLIGRVHDAREAVQSFHRARRAGFHNINLDLMFGLPSQSMAQWRESVTGLLQLHPEHLSCYSLIVEDGTPFGDAFARGKLSLPGEDDEYEMYRWVIQHLTAAGYEHYEISNFARGEDLRSLHNQIYWWTDPFLGFGPGAHGFWNGRRYENLRLPAEYADQLKRDGSAVAASRDIGRDEEMDDTMIFGLRLLEGVFRERFRRRFGEDITDVYSQEVHRLSDLGLLEVTDQSVRLSPRGVPLANQVFRAFLRD